MTILYPIVGRVKAFLHVNLSVQRPDIAPIVHFAVAPDVLMEVSVPGVAGVLLCPFPERVAHRPHDREEHQGTVQVAQPLRNPASADQVNRHGMLLDIPRVRCFVETRRKNRGRRTRAFGVTSTSVPIGHPRSLALTHVMARMVVRLGVAHSARAREQFFKLQDDRVHRGDGLPSTVASSAQSDGGGPPLSDHETRYDRGSIQREGRSQTPKTAARTCPTAPIIEATMIANAVKFADLRAEASTSLAR